MTARDLLWAAAYLLMIGVTRALYEIATPNPYINRWGERDDDGRFAIPLFWPVGLPLIGGHLLGQCVRKIVNEINREDEA